MARIKHIHKHVTITITEEEHKRLVFLANEAIRSPAGYMRWLLHSHFRELDKENRLQNEDQTET